MDITGSDVGDKSDKMDDMTKADGIAGSNAESTNSDKIFQNFGDFGMFPNKRPLSQLFNVAECNDVSVGTFFRPGATLTLGEKEKLRKCAKVAVYLFHDCRCTARKHKRDNN